MENRKQKEENEMEIDLVSLFFYLIDKWKLLFLGAVVGVVLAGALVFFQTPMYESNSTLYVLSISDKLQLVDVLQSFRNIATGIQDIARIRKSPKQMSYRRKDSSNDNMI